MYDLLFLGQKKWSLVCANGKSGTFSGTLDDVMAYCLYIGFELKELDTALDDMTKNCNNAAHFGVMKSFIYSFDQQTRLEMNRGAEHGLH